MNNYPIYGPEAPPPTEWPRVPDPFAPRLAAAGQPQLAALPLPPVPADSPFPKELGSAYTPPLTFEAAVRMLEEAQTPAEVEASRFGALKAAEGTNDPNFWRQYVNERYDAKMKTLGYGGGGGGGGIGLMQLAEQARQFDEQMVFEREREKQRIQEAMSSMKMQGAGLQTGAITNAMQLMGQIAPFAIPPGMEYLPGREPGGTLSALAQMGGWNYTPEQARGTPIDLNPMLQLTQQGILGALSNLGG